MDGEVSKGLNIKTDSFNNNIKKKKFMEAILDIWNFITKRKKYWLAPVIFILLLLGIIIVFASSSSLAPFIYTLF